MTPDTTFTVPSGDDSKMHEKVYTVSEITRQVKRLIEAEFPSVWVEGEISNFVHHTSGHMYFSLKDRRAQLRCVMFRTYNGRLTFRPENGMKVRASGAITVYEPSGQYQLTVFHLVPAGIGELQLAFEALKKKLAAEGLFDPAHKKAIPAYPATIAMVTSPTGAAIRDMVKVIRRRFPAVELLLYPVQVQGEGSARQIAEAIDELNRRDDIDVMIVGRGGGSLEDLWAFNEEVVARAIYRSNIPVISAVGHEIDFTIADFVADVRAATPSHAGEIVVRDSTELKRQVDHLIDRAYRILMQRLERYRVRVGGLVQSYHFLRPRDLVFQKMQRLDDIEKFMHTAIVHRFETRRNRFDSLIERLRNLDPRLVLKRGYSICQRADTGHIVTDSAEIVPSDQVNLRFWKGRAHCIVETTEDKS
jgi:exodeoxyribonuclease VII large subunit